MLRFKYSSLINASVKKVWEFHQRDDILQLLTPPWQPVKIIRREGGLEIGAISEFCLLFGVINLRWVARHIECEPYKLFTDQQIEGPMKHWIHRHKFQAENEQTRLIDEIEYEIFGGWLVELLLGWWVDSRLREMFRYRHNITKQKCEGK
jgi:ligand-binding SRPBCC domain-containing protein